MAHGEEQAVNWLQLAGVQFTLPGLSQSETYVVAFTWVAMAAAIAIAIAVAVGMRTVPRGLQNVMEVIIEFLEGYIVDIIGRKGLAYFPLIITVFGFILVSNYLGLVPGCIAPTGNINTTAAWAILVFVFYQYLGFSKHGLGYLKHFLGPVPVLAPFMFVVEIISEFARPLSLSVRLFANILAGEIIIGKFLMPIALAIIPLFWAPVFWMTWESIITAPIQAFIFSLMTMIYIGGAVAAGEHE
jgi:F-type H+-transporting ATPase subunit a